MQKSKPLLAAFAIAILACPAAVTADETKPDADFPVVVPQGWVIDYQTGGHQPKTVLVPAGESSDNAAVTITIVDLDRFGTLLSPQGAIEGAREKLLKACPAAKVSESRSSGKGPGERSFARLDCSAPSPKAAPLSVFAVARREQTSLRLTSIAYKRKASDEDIRFALGYLGEAGG